MRGKKGEETIMGIGKHGGLVSLHSEERKRAGIIVDEHGGKVILQDAGGVRAGMSMGEHGGRVSVYGKETGMAMMDINESGDGGFSSWDSNGVRKDRQ